MSADLNKDDWSMDYSSLERDFDSKYEAFKEEGVQRLRLKILPDTEYHEAWSGTAGVTRATSRPGVLTEPYRDLSKTLSGANGELTINTKAFTALSKRLGKFRPLLDPWKTDDGSTLPTPTLGSTLKDVFHWSEHQLSLVEESFNLMTEFLVSKGQLAESWNVQDESVGTSKRKADSESSISVRSKKEKVDKDDDEDDEGGLTEQDFEYFSK